MEERVERESGREFERERERDIEGGGLREREGESLREREGGAGRKGDGEEGNREGAIDLKSKLTACKSVCPTSKQDAFNEKQQCFVSWTIRHANGINSGERVTDFVCIFLFFFLLLRLNGRKAS